MKANTPISCEDVARQLWAYIDGELTPEAAEQIREHLDDCAHCFPRYDFHSAFVAFLSQQAEQPAPPALRRRIFERLLRENERHA